MAETRRARKGSAWRRWHRRLGMISALFVLLLAVTGVLLNHTAALHLDQRQITAGWLLDWYGLEPAGEAVGFASGGFSVSWLDGRLFLGRSFLAEQLDRPVGAVRAGSMIAVGFPAEMRLFTAGGQPVDRLDATAGVPAEVRRIGLRADGRLVLEAAGGNYLADADLTGFVPADAAVEATWSQPAPVPEATEEALRAAWRGQGLPLGRVLLDLHSGRFWGRWGVWLMDAMALLFIVLAVTGVWLWWLRGRNGGRFNSSA